MSLTLYFHPLSSFCMKALVALYENDTPFEPHLVDLGEEKSRAEFLKLWPVGKFPVLRDDAKDRTIPESTIIIEYLALHYPGRTPLLPADPDRAIQTRLWDRLYDHYIHLPMQAVVGDRMRSEGQKDSNGVAQAKARMTTSYGMVEREMAGKKWAMGDAFSMADCAAAPALYYADMVLPFADTHKHTAAYLSRLMARPSFARAIEEAKPYFSMFPQ